MINYNLFLLLVLVLPLVGYSQNQLKDFEPDRQVTLKGEILNKEDGEKVPFVHIINKNNRQGTNSDLDGNFEISISRKDTVIFSAVGYEKFEFTLSNKETALGFYNIRILLDVSYYELSTVEVYAFKDEATFKQDILNLQIPEDPKYQIDLPKPFRPPREDLAPSIALGGPITAIQNIFSKEANELKKYAQALEDEANLETIRKKFNREMVAEITGLKEAELNDFILYCRIPDDFILRAGDYEIIQKVKDCYKDFLSAKN